MVIIKWTNKFSNESGFVKEVKTKEQHFVNTFNQTEAKTYKTDAGARKIINKLIEFGEANNNNFEVVSVD